MNTINRSVKTFEGAEGVKTSYLNLLSKNTLDIVCLSQEYQKVLGEWFDMEYYPQLKRKNVREIAYGEGKSDAKKKYVKATSESDMIVTDTDVTMISFNTKNPFAVVISDPEIVVSTKAMFEAMWKSL